MYAEPTSVASVVGAGPVVDALGLRPEQGVQRRDVEALDVGVGRVGGHGQPVDADGQLRELDAGRFAGGLLLVV